MNAIFVMLLGFIGNLACGFSTSTSVYNRLGRPKASLAIKNQNTLGTQQDNLSSTNEKVILSSRGGGTTAYRAASTSVDDVAKRNFGTIVASLWGTTGVVYILAKAIKRVVPIAMEPFVEGGTPLNTVQLCAYIITCLFFAYVEGYKGFHLKFSPLVVRRSLTLNGSSPIHHLLLGPFYSMALFHATSKRMKVSWGVTIGVAMIVAAVKKLSYPWRNIIDAGVVVGLTIGSLSMLISYTNFLLTGSSPSIDPALPDKNSK